MIITTDLILGLLYNSRHSTQSFVDETRATTPTTPVKYLSSQDIRSTDAFQKPKDYSRVDSEKKEARKKRFDQKTRDYSHPYKDDRKSSQRSDSVETRRDHPKNNEPKKEGAFFVSIKALRRTKTDVRPGEVSLRWSDGESSKNWHWFVKYRNWEAKDSDPTNECSIKCGVTSSVLQNTRSIFFEDIILEEIEAIINPAREDKIYATDCETVKIWLQKYHYGQKILDYNTMVGSMADIVVEDSSNPSGTSSLNVWNLCRSLTTDGKCFFHNRSQTYKFDCARQESYMMQQHWILSNSMFK